MLVKRWGEVLKCLALPLLQQNANHISAEIFLSEESVNFLSKWDRYRGRHPNLRGFTGLHCISYIEITEITSAMVA